MRGLGEEWARGWKRERLFRGTGGFVMGIGKIEMCIVVVFAGDHDMA
jgi:hypothetical protein